MTLASFPSLWPQGWPCRPWALRRPWDGLVLGRQEGRPLSRQPEFLSASSLASTLRRRPSFCFPGARDGKGSSLLSEEGLRGVSAVSAVGPLRALVLMVLAVILTQYLF